MTRQSVLKRLALREYVPAIAVVLAWLGIAAAVGHADMVRLFAAVTFVRAAGSLTAPSTLFPLRLRIRAGMHESDALRTVLGVEAWALAGSLVAVAAAAGLLWAGGQGEAMLLCLLFSLVLPTRSLLTLAAGRWFGSVHRLTVASAGVVLVAAGWMAGSDVYIFALLMAARPWIALPITYAFTRPVRPREGDVGKLDWREVAAHSYRLGRKRAAYRFSRTFLNALLGPLGSFAARTGRGMRLDRKAERFVPARPATLGAITAAGLAAAIVLTLYFPEPALLVVAASLARIAAAAANVLIWGRLSGWQDQSGASDEDDDED